MDKSRYLDAGDAAAIAKLMKANGWLSESEALSSVERAGEGNMNLTLRLRIEPQSSQSAEPPRSVVLKQARPWVEKYPQIEAPIERAAVEAAFYRAVRGVSPVRSLMPELLGFDEDSAAILLEDLGGSADATDLYSTDRSLNSAELEALHGYLEALHSASGPPNAEGERDETLRNREMRSLNHEHIFVVPFADNNGLDLDQYDSGLAHAARRIAGDADLVSLIGALGDRYLSDGETLLHGDFFPGSWLRTGDGTTIRVIDPEFAFYGDPEFDVGVALAHLVLAKQSPDVVVEWLDLSFQRDRGLDAALVAGFAGVEVLRRLLGVAQLPIPPNDGSRCAMVEVAVRAVRSGSPAAFLDTEYKR